MPRFVRKGLLTRLVSALASLVVAVAVTGAAADGYAKARDPAVPDEILVKLRTSTALADLLDRHGLVLRDQFGSRPIYRLAVPGAMSVTDAIDALRAEADVLLAEPNHLHEAPESRKNVVWALGTAEQFAAQWAPGAIGLAEAHRLSVGAGVRVAVLDTGIDRTHPLFGGRVLPGFDFVDFDDDPEEVPGKAFGHGTHVAGIVAMVAPAATIVPLRVLDADGRGNAWVLAEALLYAVDPDGNPASDDGAHVINLSLGTAARTRVLDTAMQLASCAFPDDNNPVDDLSDPGYDGDKARCAATLGAVVVAAAGNEASATLREYPAAEGAYGLLAVAASDAGGRIAGFSNRGNWIDLAAPGDAVTSALPRGHFGTWSGTSMGAPMVAGTAALVRSIDHVTRARDLAVHVAESGSPLCGTSLPQVDAAAAVRARAPSTVACR